MAAPTQLVPQQSTPQRSTAARVKKVLGRFEGYFYLLPSFVILSIFIFLPAITTFTLSLNRTAPFGSDTIFVGLGNYRRLLTDPQYYEGVVVTFWFIVGTVPLAIVLAVALAIALSYPLGRLSPIYQMLVFLPVVISSAVTGILFRWLFNPIVGNINYLISLFGVDGPNWLASRTWSLVAVIIAVVWGQLGFNVIIALAGVQNIDETLYEAAKVDGAKLWQRIRYVTLPMLTPTLFFLSVINVIFSLQAFAEINILTDGGPGRSTTTLIYAVYRDAFIGTPQRGYASAQAYLLLIVVVLLSLIQFKFLAKKVHYQ